MNHTKMLSFFCAKTMLEIPPSDIDNRLVGLKVTIARSNPAASFNIGEEVVTVTQDILRTRNVRCNTWCAWDMKNFTDGSLKIYIDELTYMLWLAKED